MVDARRAGIRQARHNERREASDRADDSRVQPHSRSPCRRTLLGLRQNRALEMEIPPDQALPGADGPFAREADLAACLDGPGQRRLDAAAGLRVLHLRLSHPWPDDAVDPDVGLRWVGDRALLALPLQLQQPGI